MGDVGKTLDPTGGSFLGLGGIPGRVLGDVFTGGLAEFGRPDSFGLPPSLATPLKIGGGAIGGAMLGGPFGALAGGSLGGLLGGNPTAGLIGGGLGGLASLLGGGGKGGMFGGLGGLQGALGGSLLGLGLAKDTSIPDVQFPNAQQDIAAIGQQGNQQQDLINRLMQQQQSAYGASGPQQQSLVDKYMTQQQGLYGQQNDLLKQAQDAQRRNLMGELTTGPEGEAFREKYNQLGLLNSGAFNTGLANQFGNLERQQEQDILNQRISQTQGLSNILGQGYGVQSQLGLGGLESQLGALGQGTDIQSQLGLGGLQRQFGLEDVQSQFGVAKALQEARQRSAEQEALIGTGGYLLGGGAPQTNINVGGGGDSGGGGSGGIFSQLGNLFPSLFGGIKNIFGGGGGGGITPATGNPMLDLYAGGNPFNTSPNYRGLPPRNFFV